MMKSVFRVKLMALLLGWHSLSPAAAVDRVVAQVQDDVVLASELQRRVQTVSEQFQQRGMALPAPKALRKQVLERLIDENLQYQMAVRQSLRVEDDELNEALNHIAQQENTDLAGLRSRLATRGQSFNDLREDVRKEILIQRIRQQAVSKRIFVSDQEINSALELNDSQTDRQYHLAHILLPLESSASDSQQQQQKQKADSLLARLTQGEDFKSLAIAESKAEDALEGGDLGWRPLSELPSLFAEAVRGAKAGQVIGPVKSPSGLHILKLLDIQSADPVMVREVHARHILIKPSTLTSDELARLKLQDLRQKILSGNLSFDAAAREFSEDFGSASQGGDLGWSDPSQFVPQFTQTLHQLEPNQISQPIQSQFGWHLIQLLGWRDEDKSDELKRQQLIKQLRARKYDGEVEAWLREIRGQAYIKIVADDLLQ